MGKKIDTISLVHPQTGEQLEGDLFPGYGGSGAAKSVSIPGNSRTVARYNHGHTTAEVQPESGDQTNLYITQELLTKPLILSMICRNHRTLDWKTELFILFCNLLPLVVRKNLLVLIDCTSKQLT